MSENKNVLKEAVLKDPEMGEHVWKEMTQKAGSNPFYQLVMREALYKDVAQALGAVHDVVVSASKPACIGRELIWVVPTKKYLVRFIRAKRGKAWRVGQTKPPTTGEKYDYADVECKYEIAASQEWNENFFEDASWNVLERQVEEIGFSLAEQESKDIIALYNGIVNADLASGAEVTIASPITWDNFTTLWATVENENFHPNVLAVSPTIMGELLRLNQFVQSLYYAPEQAIRTGIYPQKILNVTIVVSSLLSKSLMIDTRYAAAMPLRRDATAKPYENPAELLYGVIGSERYGLGVLRSKAVARGTR